MKKASKCKLATKSGHIIEINDEPTPMGKVVSAEPKVHFMVLTAKIPSGKSILSHRVTASFGVHQQVEIPPGSMLFFALDSKWAAKGLVATNAPGGFIGEPLIQVVNCGREILDIKDGDHLAVAWCQSIVPVSVK